MHLVARLIAVGFPLLDTAMLTDHLREFGRSKSRAGRDRALLTRSQRRPDLRQAAADCPPRRRAGVADHRGADALGDRSLPSFVIPGMRLGAGRERRRRGDHRIRAGPVAAAVAAAVAEVRRTCGGGRGCCARLWVAVGGGGGRCGRGCAVTMVAAALAVGQPES